MTAGVNLARVKKQIHHIFSANFPLIFFEFHNKPSSYTLREFTRLPTVQNFGKTFA